MNGACVETPLQHALRAGSLNAANSSWNSDMQGPLVEAMPTRREIKYCVREPDEMPVGIDHKGDRGFLDRLIEQENQYQAELARVAQCEAEGVNPFVELRCIRRQKMNLHHGRLRNVEVVQRCFVPNYDKSTTGWKRIPFWMVKSQAREDYASFVTKGFRGPSKVWKAEYAKARKHFTRMSAAATGVWMDRAFWKIVDDWVDKKKDWVLSGVVDVKQMPYAPTIQNNVDAGKLFTWSCSSLLDEPQYRELVDRWIDQPHVFSVMAKELNVVKELFAELHTFDMYGGVFESRGQRPSAPSCVHRAKLQRRPRSDGVAW